jgi:hypothetical protein
MLMNCLLDAKNNMLVGKALAIFGLLRYWHDTAQIPHDVTSSVGMPPRMHSFTCPVFALKRKNDTVLHDEDEFLDQGHVHLLPAQTPR